MNKELEALKRIKNFLGYNYCSVDLPNELKCVEQALQRLEAIDNANPSEALDKLKTLGHICVYRDTWTPFEIHFEEEFTTIKQALIKAQEQEKVLEIIDNKMLMYLNFIIVRQ